MPDWLDALRKEATAKTNQRRQRVPFIAGPIPLPWITTAAQLPGKALAIGVALWWRHNLTGDNPVKLTRAHALRFGVRTRAGRSTALDALKRAELVTVERGGPKSPRVTLINTGYESREPPRGEGGCDS